MDTSSFCLQVIEVEILVRKFYFGIISVVFQSLKLFISNSISHIISIDQNHEIAKLNFAEYAKYNFRIKHWILFLLIEFHMYELLPWNVKNEMKLNFVIKKIEKFFSKLLFLNFCDSVLIFSFTMCGILVYCKLYTILMSWKIALQKLKLEAC